MAGRSGDKVQTYYETNGQRTEIQYIYMYVIIPLRVYCKCYSCWRSVTSVIFNHFLEALPQALTLLLDKCSIHKATKSLTRIGLPESKKQRNGGEQISRTAVYTYNIFCAICPIFESSRVCVSIDQTKCQLSAADNITRITQPHHSRDWDIQTFHLESLVPKARSEWR